MTKLTLIFLFVLILTGNCKASYIEFDKKCYVNIPDTMSVRLTDNGLSFESYDFDESSFGIVGSMRSSKTPPKFIHLGTKQGPLLTKSALDIKIGSWHVHIYERTYVPDLRRPDVIEVRLWQPGRYFWIAGSISVNKLLINCKVITRELKRKKLFGF